MHNGQGFPRTLIECFVNCNVHSLADLPVCLSLRPVSTVIRLCTSHSLEIGPSGFLIQSVQYPLEQIIRLLYHSRGPLGRNWRGDPYHLSSFNEPLTGVYVYHVMSSPALRRVLRNESLLGDRNYLWERNLLEGKQPHFSLYFLTGTQNYN